MGSPAVDQPRQTVRFATMAILLGACFLLGGASRNDAIQLAALHPLAILCASIFLLSAGTIRWHAVRAPLALLAALAGVMAVQLIPLPPSIWANLPGHAPFLASADVAGLDQPWRPISLSPDLTLSSLISLVVPFAVLVGFAALSRERSRHLLPLVLLGVLLSATVGLGQLSGGEHSALYFFSIANFGAPTGFFANRNHQAVFLAIAFPMLPLWVILAESHPALRIRSWVALASGSLLLLLILACGSRAGLAIGLAGLVVGWLISGHALARTSARASRYLLAAVGLMVLLAIAASVVFSRDEALQRMVGITSDTESRLKFLPTVIEIAKDFFPVGTGFGTFDPLYRVYEPLASLSPQYLNHAHDDLAELILTGGLPALLLLGCLLAWVAKRAALQIRLRHGGRSAAFARLGLFMVVALLLASVVDYPLRTPLLAAMFALGCAWLSDPSQEHPANADSPR
jgi:O-antigen ligase